MYKSTVRAIRVPYLMFLFLPFWFLVSKIGLRVGNILEINPSHIHLFLEWVGYILTFAFLLSIVISVFQVCKTKLSLLKKVLLCLPRLLLGLAAVYAIVDSYYNISSSYDNSSISSVYSGIILLLFIGVGIYSFTIKPEERKDDVEKKY